MNRPADLIRRTTLIHALAGLLAVACVWQTLRLSLAETRPTAIVGMGLPPVEALEVEAQRRLVADGDPRGARGLAARALGRTPLSPAALAVIGGADLSAGRGAAADAVLRAGRTLSRRDALLNLLHLRRSAEAGRVADMAADADIALRAHPAEKALIWPALMQEAAEPGFAHALAARLAAGPPWRLRFVQAISTAPDHVEAAWRLLLALKHSPAPPVAEEVQDFIATGVGRVPPAELRRRWLAVDPGTDRTMARRAVYDGGFDRLAGAPPFNWRLASGEGGVVSIASGRLAVRSGGDGPWSAARQLILLPPGPRRIGLIAATLDDALAAKLSVALDCLDGRPAGRLPVEAGPAARRFATVMTVPDGCDAQWLSITAEGAPGLAPPSFWIDDVGIG